MIYSFNLLPLGGFVKITGESGDAQDNPRSFINQAIWKRALVLSAGVLMNFILAWVLFSVVFFQGIPQALDDKQQDSSVTITNVVVADVLVASPAALAGLQLGDEILAVNDQNLTKADDIIKFIQDNKTEEINFKVKRQTESLDFKIKPEFIAEKNQTLIGIVLVDTGIVHYGFWASIWQGLKVSAIMVWRILEALYQLFASLIVSGKVSADLSGPIGVAVLTGQVAKMGWLYLLQFTAILSVNLGVLNILPIPALDGGRLLFVLIEKIRGKRIKEKTEVIIHNTGFALLMLLVVVVTLKDIGRYGGDWWQSLKNIFS
jgi:regulator of sigma E protease